MPTMKSSGSPAKSKKKGQQVTMKCNQFEIKIAVMGYVSVGKSTVLNALLGKKFSEVSMKRTTACVNHFKIVHPQSEPSAAASSTSKAKGAKSKDVTTSASSDVWYDANDEIAAKSITSAAATHETIKKDNQELRASNVVQEKSFVIQADHTIVSMRSDCNLVITDIPGINEAGTDSVYKNWVSQSWKTFDCVIVVMDALQGVNTEEQVEILNFAKKNNAESKDIPVIVVGNKVDDPDDEEEQELVTEVREAVEKIFGSGCGADALTKFSAEVKKGRHCTIDSKGGSFSAFVPISAMRAFLYRTAAGLSLEEFKKLDMNLIGKIGEDEVGRFKWKKMSAEKKIKVVHAAIQTKEDYEERMEATNFDALLAVLEYALGGDAVQASLIEKQIQIELAGLSQLRLEQGELSKHLHRAHKKCVAVGLPNDLVKDAFKSFHKHDAMNALRHFRLQARQETLGNCLGRLYEFGTLCRDLGWAEEKEWVAAQMRHLLKKQFVVVIDESSAWDVEEWYRSCRTPSNDAWKSTERSWKTLSPRSWMAIFESLLLMMNEMSVIAHFGREKIILHEMNARMQRLCDGACLMYENSSMKCTSMRNVPTYSHYRGCNISESQSCLKRNEPEPTCCKSCKRSKKAAEYNQLIADIADSMKGTYKNGNFVPLDEATYSKFVTLDVPDEPLDPNHFGHALWNYINYQTGIL